MRIFHCIAILVVLTQLTLLGTTQSFGAVLCVEAGGRAEVEKHGCDCAASATAREDVDVSQFSASSNDEHCQSCVDIPFGNREDGIAVRVISKEEIMPNKLPSAEVFHVILEPASRVFMLTGALPHDSGKPNTAKFAPLRI